MADRIYDLTNEPNPDDSVSLPIDKNGYSEAKSTTKAQLFANEVAARSAADTAIEDGCGLNAGGSLSPEPTSTYLKNADFLAAALNVDLRSACLLLDAAIANVAANNTTIVQVDLSSTEILAIGTALTTIAAPGAGLDYHWFECDAKNFFNTTAYVSAGANGLYVRFSGSSDYIVHLPKTFLEAAASEHRKFLIASHEILTNTAIDVIAPDGNPINGDGTISFRLEGRIQATLVPGGASPLSNCCIQPLFDSFVNADLTALGNLVIHHGSNTQNVMIAVKDNTGMFVAATYTVGDEGGADPNNYITIPIGLGIAGTWSWFIILR